MLAKKHRFTFILGVLWATIAYVAVAEEPKAAAKNAAIAKALETFAGIWEIAGVQPDGATKEARQLVFHKDGTYFARDKDGKELWAGTFEIDPTASPKVWDHRSHDARRENRDVLGIYHLEADTLKVACVVGYWKGNAWVGKPRLTRFSGQEADVVIEFHRVNPKK
jgi:uncharacterized protein (TIGR03067 family)